MSRHLIIALAAGLFSFHLLAGDDPATLQKQTEKLWEIMGVAGDYVEAEKLALELIPKSIALFGTKNEKTIDLINGLAQCEQRLGKNKEAKNHFTEALKYSREGGFPVAAVDNLLGLGFMAHVDGNYVEAEELLLASIKEVTPYVNQLRSVFERKADPTKEFSDRYLAAIAIQAGIYYNLGQLYRNMGTYTPAEENLRQALEIRLQLRQSHPDDFTPSDVLLSYYSLANLSTQMGNYAKAREYFELSFKCNANFPADRRVENSNPMVAEALNLYAQVIYRLGKPKEARELLESNYRTLSEKLGERNISTSTALRELGYIHELAGYPKQALKYHSQAHSIRKEVLGANNPDTLFSLVHVGKAHFDLGQFAEAEIAYLEAKEGYDQAKLDKKKMVAAFEYGRILARLGSVEFILDRPLEKVLQRYDEALTSLDVQNGKNHPLNTEIRNERGVIKATAAATGKLDWRLAWQDFSEGTKEHLDWLGRILATGSQREHRVVLARERRGLDQLLSLAESHAGELTNEESKELFGAVLSWKGASSRMALERRQNSTQNLEPEKKAKADKLLKEIQTARNNLAGLLLHDGGEESSAALIREYDRLEHEFAILVNDAQFSLLASAGPDTIAGLLESKPKTALVEFIRYRHLDFDQPRSKAPLIWGAFHYGAFVAFANYESKATVKFVPLGGAEVIDKAVRGWRELVEQGSLYPREMDQLLFSKLWEPVQLAIPTDIHALRIAPDGLLWLLPFEAIRLNEKNYLIHRYMVSYLSTGRGILSRTPKNVVTGPALILADPDFGQTAKEAETDFQSWPGFRSEALMAQAELSSRERGSADLRMGKEAKKSVLTQLQVPPHVVYFISHGRYFGNVKENLATERSRGIVSEPAPAIEIPFDNQGEVFSEQNRARSVIALADANRGPQGRLSALETEGFDLTGTELAILSLCESGLGEVVAGQDVSGLRLAFQLAGAKSVISSLWRVSDDGAEQIMKLFLRNWKHGNGQSGPMSKAQALHEAKLERIRELMPIRFDSSIVAACPVEWASFTLIGDNR